MKTVLALDMATRLGWAWVKSDRSSMSGEIDLGKKRSLGERLRIFEAWLIHELGAHKADLIAYEHPVIYGRFPNILGVQLEGVLLLVCERLGVSYIAAGPTKIKKHATGKGNAKKPAMIAAARARWGVEVGDKEDNRADALCLGAWALSEVEL